MTTPKPAANWTLAHFRDYAGTRRGNDTLTLLVICCAMIVVANFIFFALGDYQVLPAHEIAAWSGR